MDAACGRRPLAQVLRNSLSGHQPPSATTRDTITSAIYSQRRECPPRHRVIGTRAMLRLLPSCTSGQSKHRVSASGTMLRLYVRRPGGWFCHTKMTQRNNYQMIAINITHRNSCQVVCFFIGPGRCVPLQHLDIQADNSFVTRQVVWKFCNVASEHINTVKRRKSLWQRERKDGHTQGLPPDQWLSQET